MIKDWDGKKLTPKRAAQLIIEEALDNGLTSWESDSGLGEELDGVMTERERQLIDDQIHKICDRLYRYL
tara:strand:- start:2905 stop:3111 length:207 start_codon:yes stop_codon:yes gene_type:complete